MNILDEYIQSITFCVMFRKRLHSASKGIALTSWRIKFEELHFGQESRRAARVLGHLIENTPESSTSSCKTRVRLENKTLSISLLLIFYVITCFCLGDRRKGWVLTDRIGKFLLRIWHSWLEIHLAQRLPRMRHRKYQGNQWYAIRYIYLLS